ncbi:hypothetical protein [Streptomyces sp. SID161]|uniref:hypothetical protein n=1 Tax=Streptomyces sp. SID161 TaxID=2690251 RepID=UPI00136B837B|nr:hypothetical protein [Streptomyces sp. SID161]MYW43979.1 hypothetical protein [Streptomyces sp. SID161]
MNGSIRPVHYWDGRPVPHIAAWSREQLPPQPLSVIYGQGGSGLGFQDEDSRIDRHQGVLWLRMPAARGGQPRYERVHSLRQRRAMSHLLCQMCGGPTIGSRPGDERTLFLVGSAGGRPIAEGEHTESPPIHAVCALLAVEYCPPLRRGWAAALVDYTPTWGVAGLLYSPQPLEPLSSDHHDGLHRVPFTDDRRIRWTLAARLMVSLLGVTAVTDLDTLADVERESARVPG